MVICFFALSNIVSDFDIRASDLTLFILLFQSPHPGTSQNKNHTNKTEPTPSQHHQPQKAEATEQGSEGSHGQQGFHPVPNDSRNSSESEEAIEEASVKEVWKTAWRAPKSRSTYQLEAAPTINKPRQIGPS